MFNNSVKKNTTRIRAKLGCGSLLKIGMIKWNANMLATMGQSLIITQSDQEYLMAQIIVYNKYLFF